MAFVTEIMLACRSYGSDLKELVGCCYIFCRELLILQDVAHLAEHYDTVMLREKVLYFEFEIHG